MAAQVRPRPNSIARRFNQYRSKHKAIWRSHGKPLALREQFWDGPLHQDSNELLSYNRYLAIAARVVRRSLKEEKRLAAERRGEMDLRFAKWSASDSSRPEEISD